MCRETHRGKLCSCREVVMATTHERRQHQCGKGEVGQGVVVGREAPRIER